MLFDEQKTRKVLLDGGYVDPKDIQEAEKYAKEHRGSIADYLIANGLLSRQILGQAMAESYGVPYADLASINVSRAQTLMIPEEVARKFRLVVFQHQPTQVVLSTDNPSGADLTKTAQRVFSGRKIVIAFSMPDDIDAVLANYRVMLTGELDRNDGSERSAPKVLDQVIEDGLRLKASDIHFEPGEKNVGIRFRVDGVLQDAGVVSKELYANIVNRVKVQAKLRIDEHFSAQDGSMRYAPTGSQGPVDLRVSVVPILDGEKIVIRILSSYVRDLGLADIGLSEAMQGQLLESIQKPFGMVLVAGPTGSGKTTTLYSILKIINTRGANIVTIEDPVEYKVSGVNQIQVNPQNALTFAKGLRAVLRQDPNVILVGEIRDQETADIAVNAAMTGHLLLSTFHANGAAAAIPRFIDMGIEPFLLGSTIELFIAQRLVRKICDSCKASYVPAKVELQRLPKESVAFLGAKPTLYRGVGCGACSGSGFRGRIGVFELIKTSPELQDLVAKNPSTKEVLALAKSQGFVSMFEDGLQKVATGMTTIEELLRVVGA